MTALVVWDWEKTAESAFVEKEAGLLQNLRRMAFDRKMNSLPKINDSHQARLQSIAAKPAAQPASKVMSASFNPHDKPLDMNIGNHYVDFSEPAPQPQVAKVKKPALQFPGAGSPPPSTPAPAAALPKVAAILDW